MKITRRAQMVAALAGGVVVATGGVAYASGVYTPGPTQVAFFYDRSSGNGDSNNFAGYGTARLCADAPGATSTYSFGANYRHNRTGIPDETLKSALLKYSDAAYTSTTFSTSSGASYHTNADWTYAGDLPGEPSGYSRAC